MAPFGFNTPYGIGGLLESVAPQPPEWMRPDVRTAAVPERLARKGHTLNMTRKSYRLRDLEQVLGTRSA